MNINHAESAVEYLTKDRDRLSRINADLVEALKELLSRFELVCLDADGKTDPADLKRIKQAQKAIKMAKA